MKGFTENHSLLNLEQQCTIFRNTSKFVKKIKGSN